MRKKIIYALAIILVFFLGVGSTYLIVSYYPLSKEVINKVTSEVKIEETAIEEAIEKAYDAVVVVESFKDNSAIGTGTGFVYKKDNKNGYIITNNHVINQSNRVVITFSSGEQVEAELLGSDEYADIAVLSVPANKVTMVVAVGSTEDIKLGNTVFAIGAPISTDYSGTVTKGIISGKDRLVEISLSGNASSDWLMRVIQTDAAINPGNSGGPLINLAGEVIGINSLKLVNEQIEGIGFAIPIEDAMVYVKELEKGEVIARPVLGVHLLDVDEIYALFYSDIDVDNSIEKGAVIQSVIEDSAAEKAGLEKGDVILKIEGKKIENKAELRYELYKHDVGDKIDVTYYRDEKIKDVEVTLQGTEE